MTTVDTAVSPLRLALVGGGPSCTYVMERLACVLPPLAASRPCEIDVFDRTGQFGAGEVHSPEQPVTSFLNRIVGQVAFAADESVVGAGPLLDPGQRPTLHEWCRARFEETGDPVFDLRPEDWPKRYVHGLALREQFDRYVAILRASPGIRVRLHRAEVVDLAEDGRRLRPVLADGTRAAAADHVLMLTGHSNNLPERSPRQRRWAEFARRHAARFVPAAYPLQTALPDEATGPGQVVGCAGMGLTAIDVVLHLTEGRGGTFEPLPEGGLRYRPSGREPDSIVAFSGSGLFTFARPYNAKERDPARLEHRGVFLTEEAIARLRVAVGRPVRIGTVDQRQLDFARHVFPLVVLEMAWLHARTLLGERIGDRLADAVRPEYEAFLADGGAGRGPHESVKRLLAPLDGLLDEVAGVLDAVLDGRRTPADTAESDWPVEEALRHFLTVVLGPEQDGAARRPCPADTPSPWGHPVRVAHHRFDWERTIRPIPADDCATPERYRQAMLDFMARDHLHAAQGNVLNPAKAAADGVWRDLRDVLAAAVDFGGLLPSSHREFLDVYMRHHNRLCNGAALEVMEKMRALVRHGLLDVSAGPGADAVGDPADGRFHVRGPHTGADLPVDLLVDSRVHPFDAEADVAPLYPNLLRRGMVRKWRNPGGPGEPDFEPGGLDLTPGFHPVRADGAVDPRLTFLGPPSEGVMFFQLGALRPQQNHHVMRDILCWLEEFVSRFDPQAGPARVPEPAR